MKKTLILALLLCGVSISPSAQAQIIHPNFGPIALIGDGIIYFEGSELQVGKQYRIDIGLQDGERLTHGFVYIGKQDIQSGMGQLISKRQFYRTGETFYFEYDPSGAYNYSVVISICTNKGEHTASFKAYSPGGSLPAEL